MDLGRCARWCRTEFAAARRFGCLTPSLRTGQRQPGATSLLDDDPRSRRNGVFGMTRYGMVNDKRIAVANGPSVRQLIGPMLMKHSREGREGENRSRHARSREPQAGTSKRCSPLSPFLLLFLPQLVTALLNIQDARLASGSEPVRFSFVSRYLAFTYLPARAMKVDTL